MPQSKLPDLNSAFVKYRDGMIFAYSQKDYTKTILMFRGMNSLLPEEYRLDINSAQYEEKTSTLTLILCPKCDSNKQLEDPSTSNSMIGSPLQSIQTKNIFYSYEESIILQKKYSKIWICPKCNKERDFENAEILKIKDKDPSFHKIIPDPPVYHGIFERFEFKKKFDKWLSIAISEIEHQISEYRTKYLGEFEDLEEN